jgi:phage terminase large subunit
MIDYRDHQQKIIDDWEEDGRDLALAMTRRGGKSVLVLKYMDDYLASNPNSTCYYFANTLEQAVDIIINNKTDDGRPYIGAVINPSHLTKNRAGSYLWNGKELRYRNGSIVKLAGVINSTVSKQGTNANLVIFDEAALMGNKFFEIYDLMSPSLALTGGKAIATSTPRFSSDLNRIFTENNEGWFKVRLPATELYHNGERVLSDEFLEKQRAKQSEEKFEQEWMANMEIANETSIYAKSFSKATYYNDFVLKRNEPVYVSFDVGISDDTALVFSVVRDDKVIVFDYYCSNNEPTQHYIDILKSKPYVYGKIIIPHDSKNRQDAGTYLISRASLYTQAGFDVEILKPINQLKGIETTRSAIQHGKLTFANNNATAKLIDEVKAYEWKQSKSTSEIEYVPKHNKASNTADALEYTALYFYLDDYTVEQEIETFDYRRQ